MKIGDSHRKLLLGGGTGVGILLFLAIIVVIQYITLQHPKRWDFTGTKQHSLAPQSKKVLRTFEEKKIPIQVLVFYGNRDAGDQDSRDAIRDLLDRYRDAYANLSYTMIDPDRERAVAMQHKVDSYPTFILKAGDREERIHTASEESLTNAIVKLLSNEVKKVYFLTGHGELSPASNGDEGFSAAKAQIEKQNLKTGDLVLLQAAEVPKDASLLIIAGPKTDLMDSELNSLKDYINRGGSVMLMLNPFQTPKLAAFLKDYGIETAEDIVVDKLSRAFGGDYLMPVIMKYEPFPITKDFTVASFFPETRSIGVAKKPVPHVTAKELALTSPVSWTINQEQLKSGNASFDPKIGVKGPVSVMAALTVINPTPPAQPKEPKKDPQEKASDGKPGEVKAASKPAGAEASPPKPATARVVVFGSSRLASNKFFRLQGNPDLFMNSVSWLTEDENLISIRPKAARAQPVILTPNQYLLVLLVPVVLIPLAWIVAGLVVYFYRRRTVAV